MVWALIKAFSSAMPSLSLFGFAVDWKVVGFIALISVIMTAAVLLADWMSGVVDGPDKQRYVKTKAGGDSQSQPESQERVGDRGGTGLRARGAGKVRAMSVRMLSPDHWPQLLDLIDECMGSQTRKMLVSHIDRLTKANVVVNDGRRRHKKNKKNKKKTTGSAADDGKSSGDKPASAAASTASGGDVPAEGASQLNLFCVGCFRNGELVAAMVAFSDDELVRASLEAMSGSGDVVPEEWGKIKTLRLFLACTAPSARGRGYMNRVLNFMRLVAKRHKYRRLMLTTTKRNYDPFFAVMLKKGWQYFTRPDGVSIFTDMV